MQEEWKPIYGYEELYEISSFGRVKRNNKILKNKNAGNGYKSVVLYKNNIPKYSYIHRLVATAFLENPLNKEDVNHKDSNRENNVVYNLEWCTRKENIQHCIKAGRFNNESKGRKGEAQNNSILTEKDVLKIRSSSLSRKELSKIYGVGTNNIHEILHRNTWKHI